MNAENKWSIVITKLYEESIDKGDGYFYNIIRVDGKFHHNFILKNYPIDRQSVSIIIENSISAFHDLLYVPDTKNSSIEPDIILPGWKIDRYFLIGFAIYFIVATVIFSIEFYLN